MSAWQKVNSKRPCEICGHTDWCSRSADDGASICRRQGGHGAFERQDRNGDTYWLHFANGSSPRREVPELPPVPSAERAHTIDLERVYNSMLAALPLDASHYQALLDRGLSDHEIERRGYRSMPQAGRYRIAKQLVHQFGQDIIAKAPGLLQREGDRGPYWTLGGHSGLLIPVRDLDGAIAALVVRCDAPCDGGKYRWFSSRYAGGPSPQIICHVPLHDGDTKVVRLTEGPLKSDIATALSDVLTLGLPGVTSWRLCLPVLEQLRPDLILLSFDSDWRTNPAVARSLGVCARELRKLSYCVDMESWDHHVAKGIDDLLATGGQPTRKGVAACYAEQQRGTAIRNGPRLGDVIKKKTEARHGKNDSAA